MVFFNNFIIPAMHAGDDTASDSLPPFSLESLAFNSNEDKLSPEDLAWVDSCIVKDPVLLEENWEALKKALLEVIDTGVGALGPSATGDNDSPSENYINMPPSSEEAKISDLEGHGNHAVVSMHDGVVEEVNEIHLQKEIGHAAVPAVKDIDIPFKNEIGLLLQASEDNDMELYHGDPFLHTYKEEEQKSEVVSSGPDLDSTTDKTGSTKDIFRVWDLDIPSEEADLVKQCRKAFEETSFHYVPSNIDDSKEQKDLEEESISNLIAGLGDLALNDNIDGVQ